MYVCVTWGGGGALVTERTVLQCQLSHLLEGLQRTAHSDTLHRCKYW